MRNLNFKKGLRYLAAISGGLILSALLLIGGVVFLAVSDRDEIPALVEQIVKEQTGGEVTFDHYHFKFISTFPYLTLILEDIQIHDPAYREYRQELLGVEELRVQFRFRNLLQRELVIHSLVLQGGKATLFRNTDGSYFNAGFLKGEDKKKTSSDSTATHPVFSLEQARFRDFSFLFLDSLRSKSYHLDLVDTRVNFDQRGSLGLMDIRGDWFFHGLSFKLKNGAYLKNKRARVDWRLQLDHDRNRLDIGPATLEVDEEVFNVSGYLGMGQPAYLKLVIDHPGIMLEKARGLIADNISNGLGKYEIDQPIAAKVVVEGPLISGKPAPIEAFFSFEDAAVALGEMKGTQTFLKGHFYNCDPAGPVNPHSGCLEIDTISSRLFDVVPIEGHLLIEDLIDPDMRLEATIDMPLQDLNSLMPSGKFEFRSGRMTLALQHRGDLEAYGRPWTSRNRPDLEGTLRMENASLHFPTTGLTLNRLQTDLSFNEKDLLIRTVKASMEESSMQLRGRVNNLLRFIGDPSRKVLAFLDVRAGTLQLDRFFPVRSKTVKTGNIPKNGDSQPVAINPITNTIESFLEQFNAELKVQVDEMKMGDFRASDVVMESRLLSYCDAGTTASCIFIDTLRARVYDDIPFGASLKISDLSNPHIEMNMHLATSLAPFREMLPPDKVQLHDGNLKIAFRYEGLLEDYFGVEEVMRNSDLEGTVELKGIDADYMAGKYRVEDLAASIYFNEKDLSLLSADLKLNGNAVALAGEVYDFVPFMTTEKGALKATLGIQAPVLDFNVFPVSEKEEKKNVAAPPAKPTAITRKVAAAIDQFEARLRVNTNEVRYHDFRATAVTMQGDYRQKCSPDSEATGCVQIDTFNARIFGNAPLEATFTVENLQDPILTAGIQIKTPLRNFNSLFPDNQLQFHAGTIEVAFNYRGQPHNHYDVENGIIKAFLSGTTTLQGAHVEHVTKGYQLADVNASFSFNNEDLTIERLSLNLNRNPIEVKGRFHDLLPYIFVPNRNLQATMEVFAPRFSLDHFSTPAKIQETAALHTEDHEANGLKNMVDSVLNNLNVNFRLNIGEFAVNEFEALNLFGSIHLDRHQLSIEEASMEMGGGRFELRGGVFGLADHTPHIDVNARIEGADMPRVLTNFNNFGLKEISRENIRGVLDSEISFQAKADSDYKIEPASMAGSINLKLRDGELINFPVLRDIHGFILKSRHFEDVKFATLEKKFRLQDQKILIDDLLVVSSALAFSVDGTYDLQSSGGTDLLFEVPLENLAKHGLSEEAMKHYRERKHGPSLLLEVNRQNGDLKIKPVLTRRKHNEVGKQ